MGLYLNILTVMLLGMVAGLLLALWFQLREWKASAKEAPLLAERLAEQMLAARRGLDELKRALVQNGPELNTLLSEGGKVRVELQFLLQRAELACTRLEGQTRGRVGPVPQVQVVEEVAGANGKAVQQSTAAHDPLEDLLAGLQQASDTAAEAGGVVPIRKSPKERSGPVTQAELDLQQKVAH